MVSLSWISFWMDRTYIGERLSLGITTILTIVFLLGSSNSTMPRVSYPKAIDWYLLGSFIFVFATLVSDLLIYRLGSNKEKERDKKEVGVVNNLLFKNACGPGRGLAEELRMMGIFHTHSFGWVSVTSTLWMHRPLNWLKQAEVESTRRPMCSGVSTEKVKLAFRAKARHPSRGRGVNATYVALTCATFQ